MVKFVNRQPRIDDSLRLLGNQQWFSTMDLASGYWQVAMSPEAKRKAAFVTNEGVFHFRVMPFGLCNAPATFERLMDRVLCGMRWSHCLVYLDDVISFGESVPEALVHLEVLARLSDFGLQLKAKKCTFMQTEVGFLGHIVGRTGLACYPEKLSGGSKLARIKPSEGGAPIYGICRILSPVREEFCRNSRPVGGSHAERSSVRLGRGTADGL